MNGPLPEADPEAAVRPPFDDPAWLAEVQARVRMAALTDARTRPRYRAAFGLMPTPARPTPVHEILCRIASASGRDGATLTGGPCHAAN